MLSPDLIQALKEKYGDDMELTSLKIDSIDVTFTCKNLDEACKEMLSFVYKHKKQKFIKWLKEKHNNICKTLYEWRMIE